MSRKPSKVRRGGPKREPYDRVLVVCEGSKTEPRYFKELAKAREISSANIVIDGNSDSSPISVVRYAIDEYAKEKKRGETYDRVYCVFDQDSHSSFDQALDIIAREKPSGRFHAVASVPCFEYWILLHFVYSTQPYQDGGGKSPCGNLISTLKKYIPNYEKGAQGLYALLQPKLEIACINAAKSRQTARASNTRNPSTNVDELVNYLNALKDV